MASKTVASGFRVAATHAIKPLPQIRCIQTATRQPKPTSTTAKPTSLRPSQRWAPRPLPPPTFLAPALQRRAYSASSATAAPGPPPPNTPRPPSYELTFTCVPCGSRSAHTISKQGYHHGSILITCPSCRNRHIISDHLRIFGQDGSTVEDVLKKRGQLVKRGTLGEDGDIEFWEDGTTTVRDERLGDGEGLDPRALVKNESGDAQEGDREVPGSTWGKA